jgi:uncharacterized SAM-binding protein YcdF (DUF218 family)
MTRILSRKSVLLLLSPLVLAALLCLFRYQVLAAVGNFLVVTDTLEAADMILLLNGDPTVRPAHAVDLFSRGLAPKIVIARAEDSVGVQFGAYPNVTDSNIVILKKLGVPDSQIVQLRPPGGVQHTADEADVVLAYCKQHSVHKMIIVTSDLHSRRARFIFRKVMSANQIKVMLSPIADRKYGASNWWKLEDGLIGCQNEYLKLLYYHVKY